MSSVTEPVAKQVRIDGGARTAKEWLDALASREATVETFLAGVSDLLRKTPDAGWELLAQVDQYYRRGKINPESFVTLKTHLQNILVGKGIGETGQSATAAPVPVLTSAAAAAPTIAPGLARRTHATVPRGLFVGASTDAPASQPNTPIPPSTPREAVSRADAPRSDAPRSIAVGDILRGRYRVQGLLGRGGMGTVFAAADQYRLDVAPGDQRIAIKVLHADVTKRPRLITELRREFQHLQALSHPHIVRVHEFDRDGDLAFFTMEYLSGALLTRVLAAGESSAMRRSYALAIIRDVGAAVAYAHERGVVHGDLNPGNIFIKDDGVVRVLDFGASHQLRRAPWTSDVDDQPISAASSGYASCQVLEGEVADTRDDAYGLACTAYALLTGKHPFDGDSALKARTARRTPDRPTGLNGRQWNALREGLRFDREQRPSDLKSWLERLDLRGAADHLPEVQSLWVAQAGSLRPGRWALAGAASLLVLVGGWWAANHRDTVQRAATSVGDGFSALLAAARQAGDAKVPPPRLDAETPAAPVEEAPPAAALEPTPATAAAAATAPPNGAPAPTPFQSTVAAPSPASASPPARATSTARASVPVLNPAPAPASGASKAVGPRARIELAADSVDVGPDEPMAHIIVRRSRALRDDVAFSWWTESGTAKPGRDFVTVKSHVEHIAGGRSDVNLMVPVLADPKRRGPKSFYVVIDEASDNATLGGRTLTMVTVPGSE